jgi:uncharacterized protein YjeT (DUF2065 family)
MTIFRRRTWGTSWTEKQQNTAAHRCSGFLWIVGVTAILLLAYGVRVWNVSYADLTFDEVATVVVAHRPLAGVLHYIMQATREHPPFYYFLLSLWFKVAGTEEFIVRYPSVLIGVLGVAAGFRVGKRLLGVEGGWWTAVLLAVMPYSIWAGRTGRMYALVLLLALMTLDAWCRWIQHPDGRHGATLIGFTLIGILTHYYLALLWAVEGMSLILFPHRTRPIRRPWLLTLASVLTALGSFIFLSPGIHRTLIATLSRFPVHELRLEELRLAIMDLYLYWHHSTLWPPVLSGLILTGIGWGLAWRKSPLTGGLLSLWATIPTVIIFFIPEAIKSRYLMIVFPALALSMAAALTYLRPHLLRLGIAFLVLVTLIKHWDRLFLPPDTTFSEQVAYLYKIAQPGDALVMNGPWPALLLIYYPPPDYLNVYRIPQAAPPGFNAEVDLPHLEQIAAQHPQLWVSYGAVKDADPTFEVSRWLAENAYNVDRVHDLALYITPPAITHTVASDIGFGEALQLVEAAVDHTRCFPDDTLRVRLEWEGQTLSWRISYHLALFGPDGQNWLDRDFVMGPLYQVTTAYLPERWIEQRGLRLPPGLPPGEYTLKLRMQGAELVTPESATWLTLTTLQVHSRYANTTPSAQVHTCYLPLVVHDGSPNTKPGERRTAIPQWLEATATFDDALQLIGSQPESEVIFQGDFLNLKLWWQGWGLLEGTLFRLRLTGRRDTDVVTYALGPVFYPAAQWHTGEIVQQQISYRLLRDLPEGHYHVQLQVVGPDGQFWVVTGQRHALTVKEYLSGSTILLEGAWADIGIIHVKEHSRRYHPSRRREHTDFRFGTLLRLQGYRLKSTRLHAGQSTQLVEYWQALEPPPQIYAVFNHLMSVDGQFIAGFDSWPQGGVYTTDHWVAGEVLDETYTLTVPEGTPPGTYTLYVGVYDPITGMRLPATASNGQCYPNDTVPLLTLEIVP